MIKPPNHQCFSLGILGVKDKSTLDMFSADYTGSSENYAPRRETFLGNFSSSQLFFSQTGIARDPFSLSWVGSTLSSCGKSLLT